MGDLSDERLEQVSRLRAAPPWASRFEEFKDIESMAAEIRRYRSGARGCPVHDGQIHGGEAEELRAGIEALIESDCLDLGGMRGRMQRLLDRINARDSLAHLERRDIGDIVRRLHETSEGHPLLRPGLCIVRQDVFDELMALVGVAP